MVCICSLYVIKSLASSQLKAAFRHLNRFRVNLFTLFVYKRNIVRKLTKSIENHLFLLLLDRSWPLLGRFWPLLGGSWAALGRSWAALGRSWGALGALLAALGTLLGRSGSVP